MDFGRVPLRPEELLAIGIGDPSELSTDELRAFCRIVFPVESQCGVTSDHARLVREAQQYLLRATARDLLKNFQALPNADIASVDSAIKEASVYVQHLDGALEEVQKKLPRTTDGKQMERDVTEALRL